MKDVLHPIPPIALDGATRWRFLIEFFVSGTPAPGGSKTAIPIRRGGRLMLKNGRPILRYVDDGKHNAAWKKRVATIARAAYSGEPLRCRMKIEFDFTFGRPASHYRTGRYAAILRPDAPRHHMQKPDLSKLIRSTEDALTGILWADDCLITEHGRMRKSWGDRSGAAVRVWVEADPQMRLIG